MLPDAPIFALDATLRHAASYLLLIDVFASAMMLPMMLPADAAASIRHC